MLEPPGPRGTELFSVLNDWRKNGLVAAERLAQRYGDVVCAKFPGCRAYLLNHPDYIRRVLIDGHGNYLKPNASKSTRRYFGNAMQLHNGETALRLRRAMTPAFQRSRVTRDYCGLVVEATRRAADRWTAGPRPGLTQDLSELALTANIQIHFGTAPGAETEQLAALFRQAVGPLSGFLPGWIPVRANRKYRAAIDLLNRDVYARIQARRASGPIGPDLLSCFVSLADDGLTDLEIRNELLAMMATFTTLGIALDQMIRQVGSHPAVDATLDSEATRTLGGRLAAYEDLANLPYSEQVVKEVLRAAPPAGMLARIVASESEIGGWKLPPGSRVFVSPWVMHRDARWFDEPLRFKPERWTSAFESTLPACVYFPFGRGPRTCMAGAMSMVILRLMLVTVTQRYQPRTAGPGGAAAGRRADHLPVVLENRR